jgi:outer membrane protein assembly factor BamB
VDNTTRSIYVGSDDFNFYGFKSNGTLRWTFRADAGIYSCTARSNGGTVYGTSFDGIVYAINSNGTLAWTYATGDKIISSVAIDAGEKIYFGSDDSCFYILNADGSLFWSFVTGDKVESSPAIGSDGRVYVGSYDRNVYCIVSAPTPTSTATPTVTPTTVPYIAIAVLPNIHGTYEFARGDKVVLGWESHLDLYGLANTRMNVYLGAVLNWSYQNPPVTVAQLTSTGTLYFFDSRLAPTRYVPPKAPDHTWENTRIPETGTIVFTVPRGAAGDWVFATAFSHSGQYAASPPVVVSNQFTIH